MRSAIILCLLAGSAAADVKGPGGKVIDCYCTDTTGGRIELGETICLHVDGRMFMAQCQMSLNVPMWREISEGCEVSRLSLPRTSLPQSTAPLQTSQPVLDTPAVAPEI
ncbi:hypothetical protein ATO6_11120 [Oceanicola sp. 22II-s10i]|uniref:hypothetical protein n=1 Tax=Oceanicola sp. 22II-s10i TaxID=1317116 RepID=UPI000B527733|nr:hypothetical protein [Oceanicola sp. 22II-s10i]OWU84857.1 hypothetical protein ATO6_11120 [Oceanicola sp. 22II-s10i]